VVQIPWTAPKTWSAGETLTAANFNTHIRDNEIVASHLIVYKTADESVTSSNTFQPDDHLTFAVAANEIWVTTWRLMASGDTAADIKFQWTFPSGGTIRIGGIVVRSEGTIVGVSVDTGTSPAGDATNLAISVPATGARLTEIQITFSNGGTAGNLALEWAQNSSSATATVLKQYSAVYGGRIA
jgi:hypothetical protein